MQGSSKVLVEQKAGDREAFGRGRKVHMTFGELVQQLQQGNDSLYLTTQEVETFSRPKLLLCCLTLVLSCVSKDAECLLNAST